MVDTSDPPSDERKRAEFWKRVRGISRKLVNRQTFMIAIRAIHFGRAACRNSEWLFGDF